MNRLKYLLSITCLLACILGTNGNLFAQTDYIITNNGDKVMGEVKSHTVDKVKFLPAGQKKSAKYKPSEIKEAYKAGHGVFRSILVPKRKKPCFLQVLEDGKIKLYEYYKVSYNYYGMYGSSMSVGPGLGYGGGYNSTKKTWYAQKDGGELVDIKTNQIWGSRKARKEGFLNLVNDNKHVADRYAAEDKFNFDFVRSLIVEYNSLSSI